MCSREDTDWVLPDPTHQCHLRKLAMLHSFVSYLLLYTDVFANSILMDLLVHSKAMQLVALAAVAGPNMQAVVVVATLEAAAVHTKTAAMAVVVAVGRTSKPVQPHEGPNKSKSRAATCFPRVME